MKDSDGDGGPDNTLVCTKELQFGFEHVPSPSSLRRPLGVVLVTLGD